MIFTGVPKVSRRIREAASFTLVELLVVMAIIAILAALVIGAGNGVMIKAMRSRAQAEIQAMSAAAESYKADNGIYPQGDGNLGTNGSAATTVYTADDGTTAGGEYQTNSTLLFIALSGMNSVSQGTLNLVNGSSQKAYMAFKVNQVGNPTAAYSYIKDPWGASYGYATGSSSTATATFSPFNGPGFFDLWSTAGISQTKYNGNNSLTNTWLSNWTQ